MVNIKCKFILALFLIMAVFAGVPHAEAEVKITIKNNRSHNMSFAFRWHGFDQDNYTKGWFNVKAGETKTFTLKKVVYALTSTAFGYYATGGGHTWAGGANNGYRHWIHPTKAFAGGIGVGENKEKPISDGKQVYFRQLKLTGKEENGRASLTFSP